MTTLENIAKQKATLRTEMRQTLEQYCPEARAAASRAIAQNLRSAPVWGKARVVLGFLADLSEPNLDPLLESTLGAGVTVCAPRMDWGTKEISARALDAIDLIETRRHGIREPVAEAQEFGPESLDMVLVPGLAFDESGNRLGRGAGFYDRFLSGLPESTRIVGVCFEIQRVNAVPSAPHDARVRMLVTETGVFPVAGTHPAH